MNTPALSLLGSSSTEKTFTLVSNLIWKFTNMNNLISNFSSAQSSWNIVKKSNFPASCQSNKLAFFWLFIHIWWFVFWKNKKDLQPYHLLFFSTYIEKWVFQMSTQNISGNLYNGLTSWIHLQTFPFWRGGKKSQKWFSGVIISSFPSFFEFLSPVCLELHLKPDNIGWLALHRWYCLPF